MLTHSRLILVIGYFACFGMLDQTTSAEKPLIQKVKSAAPPLAQPFALSDVRLLDGPFKQAQDIAIDYLLSLEPDRLLANFRSEAGLKPKAEHYGGWESQGVSGHCGGHYLSACALAYAATGDKRLLDCVNYFVDELGHCQEANADGYVGAIPEGKRVYAEVAAGNIRSAGFDLNGVWVPNYTMHKLFAGLRDAYRLTGNRQALEIETKLTDWFVKVHANLTDDQMQQIMVAEHGGLNETLVDLYVDTGDERYLALSKRFHHKQILDPLAAQKDILPGEHANTQIPKIVGVARRHEITGDTEDQRIANFFWDRVVNHHSYVTGGHCDHEHFGPPDELNNRLSPWTTETCNVYNMLKLSMHVFGWNPSSKVADFYERALLNHMRSSQHPDGRVIYNLSLQPGHMKEYQSQYDGFTCCVGTGMENHVKYGEAIYFHGADNVWVNLFIPSKVQWTDHGVTLTQTTQWPQQDTTRFTIESLQPQTFSLCIRKPYWTAGETEVSVNGKIQEATADQHGYVMIERQWKSGDVVDVKLPMGLRTESMPDNKDRIAVFYGPTLLAADLGPIDDSKATEPFYVPVLLTDNQPVDQWVKAIDRNSLQFETDGVGKPRDVKLVPFYPLHERRFTVYLDRYTSEQWAEQEAKWLAEKEKEKQLETRTIDVLRIGEMQPERDHNLKSKNSHAGEHQGRKWRDARGGWFSFEMQVDPTAANELQCTYWGGETGNRTFDILVNGKKIASQTLHQDQPGEFFNVVYAIDNEIIGGQTIATVRMECTAEAMAGGLFGCRMLRAEQGDPEANIKEVETSIGDGQSTILPLTSSWRYVTDYPSTGWNLANFDDSDWQVGPSGFGDGEQAKTHWDSGQIWQRGNLSLDSIPASPQLKIYHRGDVQVYVNGIKVADVIGNTPRFVPLPIEGKAKQSLKQGENLVAVHATCIGESPMIVLRVEATATQGSAPAPLYRDPRFDGAADPMAVWNRQKKC
ncbi:Non-reducing end beta-L-arabinofuranosidase [Planctomycetes bacterium CA13]|uniref:Non-reducing end beta-L-arabinofuranosidase n=1 Tax=Novipirellula herctigrandis TaxID=2527986 RepID=A0A5C5Z690_9BACT|nr:Non-reducing end beta-L-arabinofuranosidase [Planctomycetes bacterium CA13]